MTAAPLPGTRPAIDPNDPATLGIHIAYMAQEVHTISDTMKEVGKALGDLQRTLPLTYAQNGRVDELSQRVNKLESDADIARGAAPSAVELAKTVTKLELEIERMRGGITWLRTGYGVLIGITGIAVAAVKLWAP